MNVKMKVLDYPGLLKLNESSLKAARKQNIQPEQLPAERRKQYIVNFHLDHKFGDGQMIIHKMLHHRQMNIFQHILIFFRLQP